jgi:hypothetical protein
MVPCSRFGAGLDLSDSFEMTKFLAALLMAEREKK